ncbi:MAG: hypothetical protein ACRDD1_15595 [Planctomycetia bacterium]
MGLIHCPGCNMVLMNGVPTCPKCLCCVACGRRRVTSKQAREQSACLKCSAPYCDGCGRCHVCGEKRYLDGGPCDCGYPTDLEIVERLEKSQGLATVNAQGCPSFLLAFTLPGFLWHIGRCWIVG